MSFKIGQIRKGNLNNVTLTSTMPLYVTYLPFANPYGEEKNDFQDFCLTTSLTPQDDQQNAILFREGLTYYIRFAIAKIPEGYYSKYKGNSTTKIPDADHMDITLYLKNKQDGKNEIVNPPQEIGTFELKQQAISYTPGSSIINIDPEYQTESFVFVPDKNYDTIVFRIMRTTYDVLESINYVVNNLVSIGSSSTVDGRRWLINDGLDTRGEYGSREGRRVLQMANQDFLINSSFDFPIVQFDSSYACGCANLQNIAPDHTTPWLKMGYQSRPGSLIIINGEPIRVGSSGIYELNNGTEINSVMIPTLSNDITNIDAFLLDYAFEKKEEDN